MNYNYVIKLLILELSNAGMSLYDVAKTLKLRPSEAYRMYLELAIELEPPVSKLVH